MQPQAASCTIQLMTVRFATHDEVEDWNARVIANPDGGNIFQGYEFANQKTLGGWTPRYIVARDVAITVLEKKFLGYKLWYAPKGPGVTSVRELDNLLPELRTFARQNHVFAIKIEPELTKKVRPIQPNFSTITLDTSADPDIVLAGLNQKGRHAIRRAERDGVTVQRVQANEDNCRTMYDLLALTAKGSFSIRSYNYYKTFWQRYADAGLGQLFFAYFDGNVVAGAFALTLGKKSTYKDGASVRERTAYGASHLLQWEVIQWAKEKGSLIHDLCGAPPSDQINNPDHPHYGIGRFKTSFNKEVTDYVGAYDVIVNPVIYTVWTRIGERIVMRLYAQRHHESYY
jgi:lipid II:glycine glycyltransferase (peptidoglycan interpeptide bridge formation enzyme)